MMIRIFIGKDDVETVAYHTLCESIISQSSEPVSITPIYLKNFSNFFNRKRDEKQSNEFSFSRFLVPYLCNYEGFAIWMDCDIHLRTDISKLWGLRDEHKAVQVVQHDYTPVDEIKYLGNKQHKYPKKNWSSVMIFNNAHHDCKRLTPEYVEVASGLKLHQFKWTKDRNVGRLPLEWNWLVGEYEKNDNAKLVHFTRGTPCFNGFEDQDYVDEWNYWKAKVNHAA